MRRMDRRRETSSHDRQDDGEDRKEVDREKGIPCDVGRNDQGGREESAWVAAAQGAGGQTAGTLGLQQAAGENHVSQEAGEVRKVQEAGVQGAEAIHGL